VVSFTLSQAVTGLCTAGDVSLLPHILQACQRFSPLSQVAQENLIASAQQYQPLFEAVQDKINYTHKYMYYNLTV
jgi:hypothetical protein